MVFTTRPVPLNNTTLRETTVPVIVWTSVKKILHCHIQETNMLGCRIQQVLNPQDTRGGGYPLSMTLVSTECQTHRHTTVTTPVDINIWPKLCTLCAFLIKTLQALSERQKLGYSCRKIAPSLDDRYKYMWEGGEDREEIAHTKR
jgi:hypothetical protein